MQPQVRRVEYRMNARISTGKVYAEATEATVATPLGDIFVIVRGYHAERKSYPVLIEAALDLAWWRFCNAETVMQL